MKKVLTYTLIMLVMVTVGCGTASSERRVVCETPEAAAEAFLDALLQAPNANSLEALCAAEQVEKHFDEQVFLAEVRVEKSAEEAASEMLSNYLSQCMVVAGGFAYQNHAQENKRIFTEYVYAGKVDEALSAFAALNAGLKLVRVDEPFVIADRAQQERHRENEKKIAQRYGAEDYTARIALVSLEGTSYVMGFSLLKYGGAWYISSLTAISESGVITTSGEPVQVTEVEYMAMTLDGRRGV